ncbi:ABC transporter [Desulfuromonas versatilis]|uniref:ABC transporter n=1 Tax=Desulfuromonas versatilis TaxID=2802975 RepID=A0ABN6DSR8_9BACT|nr:ABC transporter permease [Desulfuromonas versatilis]BCR03207.1 ABC transporter [Desulfuromonas versatilis]
MRQFWATYCKDLLVLGRDRAGLLVLFFMPAVLVLVVSLVQNNVLETTGASGLQVLFVDEDGSALTERLRQRLGAIEALQLVQSVDTQPLSEAAARQLVDEGDFQFGILVPEGAGALLQERARELARQALRGDGEGAASAAAEPLPLVVFFDPTVQGIFRTAVTSSLNQVLLGIEAEEKGRELARALNTAFAARSGGFMGGGALLGEDRLRRVLVEESLLPVQQQAAASEVERPQPNAVQQNVPAWALFGMFFIVVPLSGALLRERQEGTLLRLRTLPVAYGVILLGKISAFASVCLVQFSLMLVVGKLLLPLLGTPQLDLQGRLAAAYLLALCAALAATGFGLLVGTAARSYEQASMFGAVSVVVAAALGGVMVPVYVMPKGMQAVSAFSPLAWGLEGFLEIFVRGGGLAEVAPNALCLLAFFAVTLTLALTLFQRGNSLGR